MKRGKGERGKGKKIGRGLQRLTIKDHLKRRGVKGEWGKGNEVHGKTLYVS